MNTSFASGFCGLITPDQTNLYTWMDITIPASYPGTGTVWNDIQGGRVGELLNSPTYQSDVNCGVIRYDGVNDFTRVNLDFNDMAALGPWTIDFWYYPIAQVGNKGLLSFNTIGNTGQTRLLIQRRSEFLAGYWGNGYRYANYPAPTGEWVHFTMTKDDSNVQRTYRNGELFLQSAWLNAHTGPFLNFGFGAFGYTAMEFPIFLAWQRALSDQDVLDNHNLYKNRFGL
jgi:hypothetical protein